MKLLSIDVGIKNLGVCLFETTDSGFSVIEWDSLNLLCTFKCSSENCKQPIKYYKNDQYFCKAHAKKHDIFSIPPEDIQNINKLKNEKLADLQNLCNKYEVNCDNLNKTELLNKLINHINDHYFHIYENENCNDIDLVKVGININKQLNIFLRHYNDIKYVIIENQISPIANRMKTIQGMIAQYFIINNVDNVKFVSSYNKLKLFNNKKLSYREKKKLSIEITLKMISEYSLLKSWDDFFVKSKKKDDLADSFLQGRWYLKNTILKEKIE
jgi:hypothetical protein